MHIKKIQGQGVNITEEQSFKKVQCQCNTLNLNINYLEIRKFKNRNSSNILLIMIPSIKRFKE